MIVQPAFTRVGNAVVHGSIRALRAIRSPQNVRVLRSVAIMLAVNAVGVALALLVQMLIARLAGAAAFGRYMYAMAIINILAVVGKLGYDTATLRFLPALRSEPARARLFMSRSLRDTLIASVSIAALTAAAIALLHAMDAMSAELFAVFVAGLPIIVLHATTFVTCARIQAAGQPQLAASMQTVVRTGVLLILLSIAGVTAIGVSDRVAMLASVIAAVAALAAAGYLSAALLRAPGVSRIVPPVDDDARWRSVSLVMLLITAFDMLVNQLDLLMLGTIHGAEAAGLYAPAARLAMILQFALNACNAVIAPRISKLYSEGRLGELQVQLRTAATSVVLLSAPLLGVLAIAGRDVLQLFGAEFVVAEPALQILLLGRACNALTGIAGYTLLMANQHRAAAIILGGTVLFELALGVALIPAWGMVGAAWTTTIAALLWGCAMVLWSRHRLGLNPTLFQRAGTAP